MDYYARAGGHKRCHQEHKGSQRSGTGCPQCLQPNAVHPPPDRELVHTALKNLPSACGGSELQPRR